MFPFNLYYRTQHQHVVCEYQPFKLS